MLWELSTINFKYKIVVYWIYLWFSTLTWGRYTRNNRKHLMLVDCWFTLCENVEVIVLSDGKQFSIWNNNLGMRKLSTIWVPRLLTIHHKRNRVRISKEFLGLFNCHPDQLLRYLITVDETWIQHSTSRTKWKSIHWGFPSELALKINAI